MIDRIHQPALVLPSSNAAEPRRENPADFLAAHFQRAWQVHRSELPLVNRALQVEVVGFLQCQGDWLGVIVTPWFLRLFLLNGGGGLWGDIPAGQRRYVNLPSGILQFTAEDDPDIGPFQFAPLIDPISALSDMATARQMARDAMTAVFIAPAAAPTPFAAPSAEPAPAVSRRGFLRRLTGRRQ